MNNMTMTRWWEAAEIPAEPVLITMKDILPRVPVKNKKSVYDWIKHERFPKPRLYIGNRAMWFKHEFEAWLHLYPAE